MGKLVAAFGVSHTAQMFRAFRANSLTLREQLIQAAWDTARQRLQRARPDVLVLISGQHLSMFYFDNFPMFRLGVGDVAEGAGDGVPSRPVRLKSEFARDFLNQAVASGFDLSFSDNMRLDHGFMTPLHFLTPEFDVPVVPLAQNCTTRPTPTPRRFFDLGSLLAEVIAMRPESERVAVVSSGGLSHWIGVPEMGRINADFDSGFLDHAMAGDVERLLAYSAEDIEREAGNGGKELLSWLTMLGATKGATGEILEYQPMSEWITGIGLLAMNC